MSRAGGGGGAGPGGDGAVDEGEDWTGDPVGRLRTMTDIEKDLVAAKLNVRQRRELSERWDAWAHAGQTAPPGDWRVWLIRAGRGFGKTRAGAEWVSEIARTVPGARIALVGATIDEARRVMVEGSSGILSVARLGEAPKWAPSRGEVYFPSGAVAFTYSAETPEALRGPEHHAAWCDELAKWRQGPAGLANKAWDNLMLGLRLGDDPRTLVTTTPRPVPLLRRIMAAKGTVETTGATRDNPFLAPGFADAMEDLYAGTRLGRQELAGEIVDEAEAPLWRRADIERARHAGPLPPFDRVVVGVDPPAGTDGDACGIVAVGRAGDVAVVIEDASVAGLSPDGWAGAVARCAAGVGASCVVAEANQGGAMVEAVLRAADAGLPLRLVHASKGKVARAEPVALLGARGLLRFAGAFPALEDELCGLSAAGGYTGPGRSPDRADAMVWAVTELMLGPRGVAEVRVL